VGMFRFTALLEYSGGTEIKLAGMARQRQMQSQRLLIRIFVFTDWSSFLRHLRLALGGLLAYELRAPRGTLNSLC
jgi:hypothetical protein